MSDVTVKTRIVLRNDTKTVLEASPLVLFKGEVALELNDEKKTAKFKVGDGIATYAQLPYSTLTPDEIQGTYIKSLSVSGKSISYAKGDGTTGTITTQDTTYSVATISKEGLMSAADKVKLDGITESADSVSVTQTLKSGTEVGKVTVNGTATTLYAPTNTNTTYTLTQDSTDGHKITLTPSSGTATTVTIPDNNTTYIQGTGITISNNQISNSGVRSITTGSSNGTISVNTNGTSENVAVKGLGSAAYTESTDYATASHTHSVMGAASSSAAGTTGLVPAPAAGKQASFLRGDGTWVVPTNTNTTYTLTQDSTDGHKITLTPSGGTATTITIPDNNTTYNAGTGISLSGTTFSNSGVRSITTGSSNGTISVNTNGTSANVAVKGLGTAAYTASTDYATSGHTHSDATINSAGLMSATDKAKLDGISENAKTGTVTSVATGTGLTGGTITGSGTIKAKLKSETALTNDATASGNTANRTYAVAVDKSGYLAVNVPWTAYSAATSSAAGLMSADDKKKLDTIDEAANKITVDSGLSSTSTNPVQNKVINTALGTKINTSLKGSANGVAELDANGKVPSSQLPSFVDDVIEGYYKDGKFYSDSGYATLITAESGKIYTNLTDNKIYRWSGSAYVVISDTIALGETSTTAYRGDRGKTAYDHSQITSGNPHGVTKSEIGLGNVENKSSATIRGELTKSNVTTALGYTPPTSDTNTTYTLTQDSTDGHKITLTPSSGSATTITIPDNNTTYSAGTGISLSGTTFKSKLKSETALTNDSTASGNTANRTYAVAVDKSGYLAVNIPWSNTTYNAGTGISLSGTTFSNSGVRSITTGSSNGTISVDTNGTSANVAVKGLGTAAYTASTDYATASHTHSSLVGTDITGQTVDLNTYNLSSGSPTIAYYNQKTVGGAVNITNAPVANLEFLLVVELIRYNSTTDYISKQTCYLKNNRVYTRICTNGTWGAWTQLVFTDTHYTTHLYAGSGTAANATTTNGNTKITLTDNTTVRNSVAIKGTGATTVTSDASGNITINSTDNNTTYSSKTAASGGTDVSLVTTGEKYTWNNKTSNTGTVTKVTAGTGLTGGDITTTGTIALATSGVTAGTKGATNDVTGTDGTIIKVPKITVDSYGRVTSLEEYTLTNENTTYTSKDAVNLGTDVSLVTTGEKYTWNKKISTNAELGQGYGTCTNDESTIHKVVNIQQQYALNVGGIVVVKFTNGVPANATMNINESGAKNIFYKGAAITANIINAGDIATFIYDGTYYRLISFDRDTDTTYTQGTGITISNNQISNSGVRSITTGSSNGTISVNTDGTSTDVAVNGLGSAAYTESTDYATKDHSHDDYLPLAGGTVTGVISKEQGSVVYSATGVVGTKGYINIATIKITQTYVNAPIEIAFCRRNDNIITRLYITFNNVNSTDPNIASFKYVGTSNSAWLVKSTTSTWNLYIQKNEGYDEIDIIDFHIPQYDAKKLIWTWNNTQTSTLPTTEITQVSLGGNVLSSTKASQDSAGQQINTTYIKELSVSDKTITYTKGDNTTGTITTQDTTYSPGTGLALSGTTFRTTVPRVTKSANSLPGANTCIVEEYKNGDSYNLPSNHFYHIYTAEGNNTDYATQLALGMTTSDAYYRNYSSGTWGEWKLLTNTASTTTPKENGTANVGTEINYARGDHVHPLQTSVSGNAGTATKLATPRTISLGNDFQGTATFDGSSGVTISSTHYSITVGSGISNNYPYHRIAKVENLTNSYTDIDAILMIRSYYNNGGFGIIKISLRTNSTGTASVASARWIVRYKYSADDVSIGLYSVFGSTYADVFFKTGKNARTNVYQIAGDRKWSLLKSNEVSNTTASDKLGSIEVYATIESAGTEIHSQAYSDIITAVDSSIVANANNSTKSNTLNVNRVTKDANVEPAINSSIMEEYNSGDYNLPTKNNVVYQILTSCGSNAKYATQLAISLSGSKAYIRGRVNGTWSSTWTDLTPGDATTTSSGLMSAADKNKLDLLNETGTFTVSLIGSNVGEILTTVGSYTRHGNMVHFHIYIDEADPMVVNASAGYMTITGLPYSSIRYTVVDLIYNGYLLYPIDINDSQYAEDHTRYGMGAAVNGNSITFYLTVGQNNSLGSTVYWALDGSHKIKINMRISGTYSIS